MDIVLRAVKKDTMHQNAKRMNTLSQKLNQIPIPKKKSFGIASDVVEMAMIRMGALKSTM
jgi:hypothetical protein